MSDDRPTPQDDAGRIDPGPPIQALSRLREEPSSAFQNRVMDSINRRVLTVHAMDVPYWGFSRLLLEYVQAILSAFGVKDEDDRKES